MMVYGFGIPIQLHGLLSIVSIKLISPLGAKRPFSFLACIYLFTFMYMYLLLIYDTAQTNSLFNGMVDVFCIRF